MTDHIKNYVVQNSENLLTALKELCHTPAPSHAEQLRAEYCKNWLASAGAKGVYIDEALNVIFPLNCANSSSITVFAAHTDTVFPDREPMPVVDDGEKIHCPGAADDTASVCVLLLMAKYFIENNIQPSDGILFVCNSCEEGLGNLKGTRELFRNFEGQIGRFITFDSNINVICDRCVGSHRYEVAVRTAGGHSFNKFGNKNAIAELANIIERIYQIDVPKKEGAKTTYNVGTIQGGTSVNTIAETAAMLCEYRSDDRDCLAIMQNAFQEIFRSASSEETQVSVKRVGDRPCSSIDEEKIHALKQIVVPVIEAVSGETVSFTSGSTDCNIPLSLGIPALCVGVNRHAKTHTREEWVDKASLLEGLEIAIRLGLAMADR